MVKKRVIVASWALAGSLCVPALLAQPTPTQPAPTQPAANPRPDAREIDAAPIPPSADAVDRALTASYLTPDEAREKRLFFGRYSPEDVNTPARAARIALLRGVYDDPALSNPDADVLDRAEGALRRGDLDLALSLAQLPTKLPEKPDLTFNPVRAARIRAAALEAKGQYEAAADQAQIAIDALLGQTITKADTAVEGVRLIAQRLRLRGPLAGNGRAGGGGGGGGGGVAGDFHGLMQILGSVRTKIDRLYWPALLAEAELLYSKDNAPKAQEALKELFAINPTCAEAWALLGNMVVDGFNFDAAESIAKRIDLIASDEYNPLDADAHPPAPAGTSPLSAAIIARAMLRQIDGAQALNVLAPAIARAPKSPSLLALSAAASAVTFDTAALNRSIADFDALYPGSNLAYLAVGRALSEARQYEQAAAFLEEAHTRQPFAPEPLIDRGLLEVQAGRDEQALSALEEAFRLDPFNVRADNSLRLVRELQTYERIESAHYVIRFKPADEKSPTAPNTAPDIILASEMSSALEHNHELVTRAPTADLPGGLDHQLPGSRKTLIDLMPDHQWFGVRIAGMPRIHTVAASTGPVIAMESPREGPDHFGPYDWSRVLRHEYAHTISLSRTDNRIPHWFTEACAVYVEYAPRDWATCQMLAQALDTDTLFDFTEINLAFVRPKKPSDRGQAYTQGHWMYEFLIKRFGPRAPLDLMDQYKAGVREEQAYQNVLKLSRAEFFTKFKAWAKDDVVSWGLALAPGTPTLAELLKGASPTPESAPEPDEASPAELAPERLEALLAQYPTHPDLLEFAVEAALRKSARLATPENAPLIERYAAARPVDPKPHRLLAKMYLDRAAQRPEAVAEEGAKAIPHLEFLDQRESSRPTLAMELAKRYSALGDATNANRCADRAVRLAPFAAPPRELAATLALIAKNYPEAQRHLAALTLIEPTREMHKKRLEALKRIAEKR